MLLPLLGACAVVGPFQGPEWEPVRGLLSEDRSCRDPRCCGNLLVLCLFLIWQVQSCWHRVTRTHPSTRKVTKMPPQKWAVPSTRHDTCLRLTPEFSFSPGDFRGLEAHVQQRAQKKMSEHRRSLQESWTRYLVSWQHPCQDPPWDFHTPSDPIFRTTSFSSICMLPQDSAREARPVPWCLSDEQSHLICRPPSPSLDMYQRMEQLFVHSQEELVPLELVVSMRSHLTPMTLATSLSNLLSSQRVHFCSGEFLLGPSNQVGVSPWKSWVCPQEAWALGTENQVLGREDSRETQAVGWGNGTESSREGAREIQATGRQLPVNSEIQDDAETKVLEWRSQRLVISKTDGDILTPGPKSQDQMGIENRAKIQELENRNKREAEGENPPETQAHTAENQEHLRCKADAETQTPKWGNQDKSRNEDAVETQAFEKNKKEARGEDEGGTHTQGLGKQGRTRSENGKEAQVSGWGKQDKIRDDAAIEIQAQERRNKAQIGGENALQTQVSGRENLGEVKREEGVDTQALGWRKQECIGRENVTEIQTLGREKQDRGGSEKAGKIQACRGEIWKQLKHELLVGWRNQGLRRGKDAGETQVSRRKNLREVKVEDWVVIQAPWWGDQRPAVSEIDREWEMPCWGDQGQSGSEIDREFATPCWGNQDQTGGEHRAETQATEKREQRKDGDEDSINTLAPEAENQGQVRHETHADTHPPERRNQEKFGDENNMGVHARGMRNLRGVKDEDSKEALELGEENQGQLSSKINGQIHTPKWKNREYIRGKDGANTEASEADNRGELTSKINGETHSVEWKKEEQVGEENGAEIQAPEKTSQTEAGGEDDTETWEAGEENQSQLKGVIDRETHLSEWKNQRQTGGENGTKLQAPEKRNQREAESEDVVETQRPERENQGQLDNETGESHSAGRSNWEQTRGKKEENQTLGRRSQRRAGSEDGGKPQGLRGGSQGLINSKVNEKSCSSEWENQEQRGGEHGADTHTQQKTNPRGTAGDDGTDTQAPGGDGQGLLRSEIDGEIQIQGQGNQNKAGDEAAEIQAVGSLRKCRAEEAGGPHVPRGGGEEQVRGNDAAEGSLPADSSGGGGPPALTGCGYRAMEQEQAVASAPCQHFLFTSGEGEHLVSQSTASAKKHREEVSLASQQPPPEAQRSQQRDKQVDPGKAPGLTRQLQNLQFLVASLGLPSVCPSTSRGQAPQAATALVGAPIVLTVMPKWPVLKKSQRLLLESLMRRKIAHLKWGLPQRILESHLLFNLLGPCPLPLAGVRLPGLYTACEVQQRQERHCEAKGFRPDLKSTERSQRVQPPERQSSKLSTRARALEKCGPHRCKPMGISIHSKKPGRVRPPGGAREPQAVQEEAPPRAKPTAHRNPRPAAQSRSWCGQEPSREAHCPSENNRDRKTVRPGVSQMAERAPCRMRTSYFRAGHNHWRKECTSREVPKSPGLKCQLPPHGRRGRLESAERGGAGQQPSSCSTNTSSFKYSLHSAASRWSMILLNKVSWSPHLAKPQHSVPNLSLRGPDPTLLPKVGDRHVREHSRGVHTSLERDLQPPGHCYAGAALPKAERFQGQGEPENLNGAPHNPSAPRKFGFMKHLRCFLLQHGFRK
ncbi:uncharacterized protein LOC109265639 [Panthera pardus]|uniref:Uncharacterized protein LOC109265639 n=1 Tax=Panthera pardus TaxID=9691 RepID=A0A9V1FH09_PANPR|nr:uncharacterized protein LOC109265639 [Panthera pardus]